MITDVVFAYSTAQNAFCCLVGAILNILCPRERRGFQSKLGVSSSNQCNLHHSPHTGHLEKKNKKKGTIFFEHGVYQYEKPVSFTARYQKVNNSLRFLVRWLTRHSSPVHGTVYVSCLSLLLSDMRLCNCVQDTITQLHNVPHTPLVLPFVRKWPTGTKLFSFVSSCSSRSIP